MKKISLYLFIFLLLLFSPLHAQEVQEAEQTKDVGAWDGIQFKSLGKYVLAI